MGTLIFPLKKMAVLLNTLTGPDITGLYSLPFFDEMSADGIIPERGISLRIIKIHFPECCFPVFITKS
jgi:hypothetical protein